MTKRLKDISQITTGVYQKGAPGGDTYYLQAKHFDNQGAFAAPIAPSPEITMTDRMRKHLLQDGDLLITAKGINNRVNLYKSTMGQAVASSIFFVIRLTDSHVLPVYLQWFLNLKKTQHLLSTYTRGSSTPSLSKKALQDISIDIPTMEKQQNILQLQKFWKQEQQLILQLLEQKKQYYEQTSILLSSSKQTTNE